jgi:hypothetical protein
MKRNWKSLAAAALALACVWPDIASAQSGAEANAWAAWCRQHGRVDNSSGTLVCIPNDAGGSSGGYSADQQAMLNLAGQFGSALGAAIRESFQRSAQQQRIIEMQQDWERQQARERAAADLERQRERNQALLASMHGTIGASELGRTQLGSETLRLRTADEMFNTPGNARGELNQEVPISAPIDIDEMRATQEAYFVALDNVSDMEAIVREKETTISVSQDVMNYLGTQLDQQRARLVLLPADSPERPAAEAELARLEASASQVRAWQAEDAIELAQLQAEAAEARAALRALEARSESVSRP